MHGTPFAKHPAAVGGTSSNRFTVELTARSWKRVGALTSGQFRRMREALEEAALQAQEQAGRNVVDARRQHTLKLGGLRCLYDVDPIRRVVVLNDIFTDEDQDGDADLEG